MITPEYVQTMARYNAWQNRSLYNAADGIGEATRRQDRGVFFGSVHATLSHLLWADTIWMSRFDGWDAPEGGIVDSPAFVDDWQELTARRVKADARIEDWAARVNEADLVGDLTWYSITLGQDISKPCALTIVHLFNHQTHHRGQVHAMLTAAGARPDDTDLPFMP